MKGDSCFSAMALLVFNGDNYTIWVIYGRLLNMTDVPPLSNNLTMAQVKNHKERKTRKSKEKACLFAAISATIFTRIMSLKSAKAIWSYLKFEYEGDDRIKGMKVLNVIRDFELQKMKESETIKEYSERLLSIANRKQKKKIESTSKQLEKLQSTEQQKQSWKFQGKDPPCKHCDNWPLMVQVWKRPDAKYADAQIANEDENDHLFVATCFSGSISSDSWLIDSGCTNHMTHDKELFKELKPIRIARVRIGHGGHIPTKGIGTVAIATHLGTKVIDDMIYVPKIDQNLLSVG
ncbi:hypothetical protein AAG906_015689 [Vitis piasezkii]